MAQVEWPKDPVQTSFCNDFWWAISQTPGVTVRKLPGIRARKQRNENMAELSPEPLTVLEDRPWARRLHESYGQLPYAVAKLADMALLAFIHDGRGNGSPEHWIVKIETKLDGDPEEPMLRLVDTIPSFPLEPSVRAIGGEALSRESAFPYLSVANPHVRLMRAGEGLVLWDCRSRLGTQVATNTPSELPLDDAGMDHVVAHLLGNDRSLALTP